MARCERAASQRIATRWRLCAVLVSLADCLDGWLVASRHGAARLPDLSCGPKRRVCGPNRALDLVFPPRDAAGPQFSFEPLRSNCGTRSPLLTGSRTNFLSLTPRFQSLR
ncbi:hypothetical protein BKA80DRAFT_128132 [Phyllosticta citrichinensis]